MDPAPSSCRTRLNHLVRCKIRRKIVSFENASTVLLLRVRTCWCTRCNLCQLHTLLTSITRVFRPTAARYPGRFDKLFYLSLKCECLRLARSWLVQHRHRRFSTVECCSKNRRGVYAGKPNVRPLYSLMCTAHKNAHCLPRYVQRSRCPGIKTRLVRTRVARWHIFRPKIPIWVNFGGSCNRRCWCIYGHWVYSTAISSNLRPWGIFHGYFVYFSSFGRLYHEKSGNPGADVSMRGPCTIRTRLAAVFIACAIFFFAGKKKGPVL
jgi:hypothetical protein